MPELPSARRERYVSDLGLAPADAVVIAGDPDNSVLIKAVRHAAGVEPMPSKKPKLASNQIEAARDTATSILLTPSAPPSGVHRARRSRPARNNRNMQAGLIVMATLLGWAATRRRSQARQPYV